jgi:hypothetical protein
MPRDDALYEHIRSIVHGSDVDGAADEQAASRLLLHSGRLPNMTRVGREKTHSARGTIKDSLYSDEVLKSVYDTHILGKSSTAMKIQMSPSVNRIWREELGTCEGGPFVFV